VQISSKADVVRARHEGRALASKLGFPPKDLTLIATAISELAHGILEFGEQGAIAVMQARQRGRRGIVIVADRLRPERTDGWRMSETGHPEGLELGLGLPGVRRLMDEFEVVTKTGSGLKVTTKKWVS
jgi:serine/threonine-protein kinase RsbT